MDKRLLSVLAALVLALIIWPGVVVSDEAGGNLLANPGFESGEWFWQDGVQEIVIGADWWAYWRESPPPDLSLPNNCPNAADTGCHWARPEFQAMDGFLYRNRVHSGRWAAKYFSFGRMHEAGLYQHVEGVPAGSTMRFSIWMLAWMCYDQDACQGGMRSDAPARMHLQVGIDPNGGWDPWSRDVVWSAAGEAFDEWKLFQIEAQVAPNTSSVTVFTRSRAEWDWARVNNDLYLDDARLEVISEEAAGASPALTATTFTTHTIAEGETLLDIVLRYGVPIEQLVELNKLPADFRLTPGSVLRVPRQAKDGGDAQTSATARSPETTSFPVATWPAKSPAVPASPNAPVTTGSLLGIVLSVLVFVGVMSFARWASKRR